MKYISFSSLFILLAIILFSCNQQKQSAKQYHKDIKTTIDTIIPYFISLDDDIALDSLAKIDKHFKSLERVVINADDYIQDKNVYEHETVFLQSTKDLVKFYKDYTEIEIKSILTKLKENPSDLDLKEQARIVFIHFYEKEQIYLNQFNKASVDFSYKYKIYQAKND